MKILIDGGNGLLGSDLSRILENKHEVVMLRGRADADITDYKDLNDKLVSIHPDVAIHCAGMKDIDVAEQNPSACLEINTLGTKNMAAITGRMGITMIQISSGAVYDGKLGRPYSESDIPHPVNVYGYSKLMAEEYVKRYNNRHFILRLPLLFGLQGAEETNMIYRMRKALAAGEVLSYTVEQICNPTYCPDVAKAITKLLDTEAFGTYNVCNAGTASRYGFYRYIAVKLGYSEHQILPVSGNKKFAKREKNIAFDSTAFQNAFQFRMRSWQEAMDECIECMIRGL